MQGLWSHSIYGRHIRSRRRVRCINDQGHPRAVALPLGHRICACHHPSSDRNVWPFTALPDFSAGLQSLYRRCRCLADLCFACHLSILCWDDGRPVLGPDRRYLCRCMGGRGDWDILCSFSDGRLCWGRRWYDLLSPCFIPPVLFR
jgi:hypothetical protein